MREVAYLISWLLGADFGASWYHSPASRGSSFRITIRSVSSLGTYITRVGSSLQTVKESRYFEHADRKGSSQLSMTHNWFRMAGGSISK